MQRKNLQATVHGFDLLFLNLPIWWQQSVLISSVISHSLLIIFINFSSQLSHFSHVSGMPSIWKLFRWDLSSTFVNFSMAISGSKRSSSISHRSVWTFLISFLTPAKPSCSSPWLNSRVLVRSTTSCGIWSRSSLVFVSWDLIINLFFSWWSSNSFVTFFFIFSIKSSLFSSVVRVAGVPAAACWVITEIFGVAFNLIFNYFEPTMLIYKLLMVKLLLVRLLLLEKIKVISLLINF